MLLVAWGENKIKLSHSVEARIENKVVVVLSRIELRIVSQNEVVARSRRQQELSLELEPK